MRDKHRGTRGFFFAGAALAAAACAQKTEIGKADSAAEPRDAKYDLCLESHMASAPGLPEDRKDCKEEKGEAAPAASSR